MSIAIAAGIFALLLAGNASPGQNKSADYSKEPFVIETLATNVEFADDGTSTREQSVIVRVQSESAVRQFGILSFAYKAASEHVDVIYIRVRKPDGTVMTTPAADLQDLSSEATRVAPSYSDSHEMEVPVKALGSGDVLEYRVRISRTKPEVPNHFWYKHNFLETGVVLSESLRIAAPEHKYVKVAAPTSAPEIRHENGEQIYLWKTAHLTRGESRKGTEQARVPSVQLTTFKSWEDLGQWYGSLVWSQAAITPAIRAKAAELTKGLTTNKDKQRAIYNYVASKFRYVSVSFGSGRYQPHSAEDVLANQYGDCKDKHTLLAALLDAAGIEAWPALMGLDITFDPAVPSPAQFNHVITVIPEAGKRVWLDSTSAAAPYGLLHQKLRNQQALVIPTHEKPVLMQTPADPPFSESETIDVEGTLGSDGTLTAHFDVRMRGDGELTMRGALHELSRPQWEAFVQNMSYALGFGGEISKLEIENPDDLEHPLHYSYDYRRTTYSDWEHRRILPPLPSFTFQLSEKDDKPVEAISIGTPGEAIYHARIRLPKDFSLELPEAARIDAGFGEYTASYSFADGVLFAERRMRTKKAKSPAETWPEYIRFEQGVSREQAQFILLAAGSSTPSARIVQNNPEAESLVQQASTLLQNRDLNAAADLLTQAERIHSQQRGLWSAYGLLYSLNNERENAIEAYQKEARNHPDDLSVKLMLAEALLRGERKEDGLAVVRAIDESAIDPIVFNNLAFFLADTSTNLPLAKEYAEKAVRQMEEESASARLATLSAEDLRRLAGLAAAWDTLGWVYFAQGDLSNAEKYVTASWQLSQQGVVGDHLGRIYEKAGKPDAATRAWQLALASNSGLSDIRERLRKAGATANIRTRELEKLRTTEIGDCARKGNAEFFVQFSPAKVEDVQFIGGDDALKDAAQILLHARYDITFPDSGPERITRRGLLSCSGEASPNCQFVLSLPSTARR
jgi:tetratricopeptide (TPR) repeat protein